MDNNINKHFDFFFYELEAKQIEAEIEELIAIFTDERYLSKCQINNLIQRITPFIDELHRKAAASRDEANRRKENIEKIQDPEIKQIIELYYIKGKTLEQIGYALYCDRTTISRKVKRYFKDI